MSTILESIFSPDFGFVILRVTTPLLFASLGVAVSALSGTINIGLEGIMLVSAFTGVMVSAFTRSLLLALIAGVAAGVLLGMILAYFHLYLKTDVIIGAIALNFFASGITIFLLFLFTGDKGTSSSLRSLVFPEISIPILNKIPILGRIASGHNVLTYFALLSVLIYFILIYKTPLGLRIRAVGQNPEAAESVGINVNHIKIYALLLSGFFGAFGGLYLAMGYVSWFSRDMTAGRGFIAIAASTLGSHMPLRTLLGSLLFGSVSAFSIYISSLEVPSDLIQLIPYAVTVIVLTIYSGRVFSGKIKKPKELI
ncbi:MAG: ABC transporter permease [Spirochaetes bacterium]|mgnify:CR=1 FL=1|nr:MAG: ABC transporter permease [Spirochaetota bacterium]